MLELAGAAPRTDAPPSPGLSLVRRFQGKPGRKHQALWWFHDGHKAIRVGDWKAVAPKGKAWELYVLSQDRAESDDVAGEQPDLTAKLTRQWDRLTARFIGDAGNQRLRDSP